ncbi:hypothetical protein PINS_up017182 [Pythium insidiosum]|nr:hypothetical protein PINS_up009813 [Pythium insidiosum]GLE07185.1 hypothetical protein PINS_up017182 [Pythium insidiosum]
MKTVACAAILALQLSSAAAGLSGGYSKVDVTSELTKTFYTALGDVELYGDDVTARVCATKIESVEQQVVAGMNYRFTVSVCDIPTTLAAKNGADPSEDTVAKYVGRCKKSLLKSCKPVKATITIFEQAWTDTLEVSSIEIVDKVHRAHKAHIHIQTK